jgi:ferredoxin
MKAKVDPDRCLGCGICEGIAPEIFELGDEGIAVVKVDVIPADLEAAAKEAKEECPEEAISLE